jgi:hypothetical protein
MRRRDVLASRVEAETCAGVSADGAFAACTAGAGCAKVCRVVIAAAMTSAIIGAVPWGSDTEGRCEVMPPPEYSRGAWGQTSGGEAASPPIALGGGSELGYGSRAMVEIRQIRLGASNDDFFNVVDYIYRGDPCYVSPLDFELKDRLNPKKNPFFQHAEGVVFCAYRNGWCVGRVTAQIDSLHLKRSQRRRGILRLSRHRRRPGSGARAPEGSGELASREGHDAIAAGRCRSA